MSDSGMPNLYDLSVSEIENLILMGTGAAAMQAELAKDLVANVYRIREDIETMRLEILRRTQSN